MAKEKRSAHIGTGMRPESLQKRSELILKNGKLSQGIGAFLQALEHIIAFVVKNHRNYKTEHSYTIFVIAAKTAEIEANINY